MSKSTWTSPRKNAGQKLDYYSRDKTLGKRGRGVKNLSAMPSLVKNSSEVQRGAKRKRQRVGYRRNTLVKKKTHSSSSESADEDYEEEDKEDSDSFEEKSPKKVQKESTPKKVQKESTNEKGKGGGVGRRR